MTRSPLPITGQPLADLLPHSPPMVLLERISHWDESRIECQSHSHLQADNPLRDNGMLSVLAGIEYAAQAMAAHARLRSTGQTAAQPRKGMIAVASRVSAHADRLDAIAAPLQIEASLLVHNSDSSLYSFNLSAGGQPLLSGQLTAVIRGDAHH